MKQSSPKKFAHLRPKAVSPSPHMFKNGASDRPSVVTSSLKPNPKSKSIGSSNGKMPDVRQNGSGNRK